MSTGYTGTFAALRNVLRKVEGRTQVSRDTVTEYTLVTKKPSPFPQHKGHPMYFAQVRLGKAYASFHLMPLYMNAGLTASVSAALRKRMQGKTCFNFKSVPAPELLGELMKLTKAGLEVYEERGWL
ncbi:MAG TPA: hypothetical protein VGU25_15885 [Acidobacteriaceae bacterium]|nr:hypothetical protein [Acidobacteriaceae bacterium]